MNKAVLVVDDEKHIRFILKESLEMSGYKVITASNGKEALDIFTKNMSAINLVLTDISMPVMNGIELQKNIHDLTPDTKVFALTGNYDVNRDPEFLKDKFTSVMSKPFNIADILAKIDNHMKEPLCSN